MTVVDKYVYNIGIDTTPQMKNFKTTHFHHNNRKKTPYMFLENENNKWFVLTNEKGFNIYCDKKTFRQEFTNVEAK